MKRWKYPYHLSTQARILRALFRDSAAYVAVAVFSCRVGKGGAK